MDELKERGFFEMEFNKEAERMILELRELGEREGLGEEWQGLVDKLVEQETQLKEEQQPTMEKGR